MKGPGAAWGQNSLRLAIIAGPVPRRLALTTSAPSARQPRPSVITRRLRRNANEPHERQANGRRHQRRQPQWFRSSVADFIA